MQNIPNDEDHEDDAERKSHAFTHTREHVESIVDRLRRQGVRRHDVKRLGNVSVSKGSSNQQVIILILVNLDWIWIWIQLNTEGVKMLKRLDKIKPY